MTDVTPSAPIAIAAQLTPAQILALIGGAAGTATANLAAVLGASQNLDQLGLPVGGLKIGASGSEVTVDATAAELNRAAKLSTREVAVTAATLAVVALPAQAASLSPGQAIVACTAGWNQYTVDNSLPEPILGFIAQNITRNIRRLEGALLKVSSYSALTNRPLDLPTAERLLHDVLMEQAQNVLTIETIQKRVADHFQIRHSDMTSKRRPNNIAIPRQIAMYLARTLTRHSLQEIGDAFGGRDHGTVIHACKAVDNMMEQDATTRGSVEFLKSQLSR